MKPLSIVLGDIRPDLIANETLVDVFKTTVKKYPEKIAFTFHKKKVTYSELDLWTDQIAKYIQENGIGIGDFIGVWWNRSAELPAIILGIVKSGATYVPLDIEMPEDRVETVLNEVGAKAIFTQNKISPSIEILNCPQFDKNQISCTLNFGPEPNSIAYVIYTSGSTGKPKGIPILQKQICHLIRSENSILNIESSDKVYQGFSVSFDMWCEEVWISFLVGAELYIADANTAKAVDELSALLREEEITVLHAVPSLLAVMDNHVPQLRIVNAGGEACTPIVLEKWAIDKRAFFNSYGPTETTVSATFAKLKSGDSIHIGSPLPNYFLAVVDEHFNILPKGEKGELIVGGIGVSPGYINRPELTSEKFVDKPLSLESFSGQKIYRTGDAVIVNSDDTINFQGRIDDQIKLRGYRIELGEIVNNISLLPNVVSAAVAVRKDNLEQDAIVGYVVLNENSEKDNFQKCARTELSKLMPAYMIPTVFVVLDEMPRLPSGKVNAKLLPTPDSFLLKKETKKLKIEITDSIREKVHGLLREIFQIENTTDQQDFFKDLGGHSLLAAVFVSRLRSELKVENVSLKDIYTFKTIGKLIEQWEIKNEKSKYKTDKKTTYFKLPAFNYYLCWIAQSIALLVIYGLFAVTIFFPFLFYYYVGVETDNYTYASFTSLLLFFIIPPIVTWFNIGLKWLIIGKYKEGDYPLWGSYYFRWWFITTIQRLNLTELLSGTPLYNFYLRSLGLKTSKDAQLSQIMIGAEDLIEIGKNVSISSYVVFNNAHIENGMLKIRRIKIGDHVAIGTNSVIDGGCIIEEWAEIKDLSYLPENTTIKKGEIWMGSPALCIDKIAEEQMLEPAPISSAKFKLYNVLYATLLFVFPIQFLVPLLPAIYVFNQLDNAAPDYNFEYLIISPIAASVYLFLYILFSSFLIRIFQMKLKVGKYSVYSSEYVFKWLSDQIFSLCLIVLHPLFASVYISAFYRLLGAKVGNNSEISTASNVTHTLLEIGNDAFIADAVTLGEADVRNNVLTLQKTTIGNRSFVGNSALIPQGYNVQDNTLIGVLSTPPSEMQLKENPKSDWFGSPAIALPNRQESDVYNNQLTFSPTKSLKIARSIVEFIRIILPQSVIFCGTILFVAYAHDLVSKENILNIIVKLPFYYLGFIGIPAFLISVIFKWTVIGKYKSENLPMWSLKVWRSEATTTTYEGLAVPFLLDYLRGTPWLPLLMKFFGVKTGKRVWLNTTDITEFDMVKIDDYAELNEDCGPQTHLFEDRVMKIGNVSFGKYSNIGSRSIVLYNTQIEDKVILKPLSLVMKGERLSEGTTWMGSPIEKF